MNEDFKLDLKEHLRGCESYFFFCYLLMFVY